MLTRHIGQLVAEGPFHSRACAPGWTSGGRLADVGSSRSLPDGVRPFFGTQCLLRALGPHQEVT